MSDDTVDYNALAGRSGATPERITLRDVTLRDGEQQIEVAFTADEKLEVIGLLERLGVTRVQVGFPARDADTVRRAKKAGLGPELELYCIATSPQWKRDIDLSLQAGADVLHFVARSHEPILRLTGWDAAAARDRIAECIAYARSQGDARIVFGPSHATRTPIDDLIRMLQVAADAGAQELLFNDTVGLCRPEAIAYIVRAVTERIPLPLGVHCHNDYGLATACTLAGVEAGATWVDVCVNGIGERAGNASLEEVVVGAERLLGVSTGIAMPELFSVSHRVAEILGKRVPPNKAVTGANAFAQKLDLHVEIVKDHPSFCEPFPPESVGGATVIRLDKSSGLVAVRHKLRALGLDSVDDATLSELVEWVNARAEEKKGDFTDEDFAAHVASAV